MNSKQKLDQALGITDEKSMNDFLDDLDFKNEDHQKAIANIENKVQESIKNIDTSIAELNDPNVIEKSGITESIQKSLNDINDLVALSKQIIQHLYNDIVSSELVDSELIASTANFIQATHDNIKEYVELYRDRLKFFDTVKLEMIRHENRKNEIELKHKLDMEKIQASNPMNMVPENMKQFNSEDIVNALKNIEV